MKRILWNATALLSAALLCCAALAGCRATEASGEKQYNTFQTDAEISLIDTTVTGSITKIDGTSVTLELTGGSDKSPQETGACQTTDTQPGGQDYEFPPDKPEYNGTDTQPSDQSGDIPPDRPEGIGNMQTGTLCITDESMLYAEKSGTVTAAALGELAVGQTVQITFAANGKITKIVVSD